MIQGAFLPEFTAERNSENFEHLVNKFYKWIVLDNTNNDPEKHLSAIILHHAKYHKNPKQLNYIDILSLIRLMCEEFVSKSFISIEKYLPEIT